MRLAKVKKENAAPKKTAEKAAAAEEKPARRAYDEAPSEKRSATAAETERWEPDEAVVTPPKPRKPKTESGREKQLVALAVDLAEKQLREGTASAQVITHYLKLGTEKEKLERDILRKQKDLITEKTNALKSASHMEEMYAKAIEAMKVYGGGNE